LAPTVEYQGEEVDPVWLEMTLQREFNIKENERKAKLEAEQKQREQKIMQERQLKEREQRMERQRQISEQHSTHDAVISLKQDVATLRKELSDFRVEMLQLQQQKQQAERDRKFNENSPRRQFEILLAGKYPRYDIPTGSGDTFPVSMRPAFVGVPPRMYQEQGIGIKVDSIEPALNYMREKWIELDEQTRNRLEEYGKPDETWEHLMNRLLDIAAPASAAAK
jgi:hypothetical protein